MEKVEDCDPAHNIIGYEAIDSLTNVRKTPKGSQGRRGLGANGQEWWCLRCLETLFVDLRERVLKHKPDGSTLSVHPLTSIQYWIIPERRTIPQFDKICYTLRSPHVHLLAKWQAVKTFHELRNRPAEAQFDLPEDPGGESIILYLGQDQESFYLDPATRDIRGVLSDNRVCEIEASNVRGYSLSEALRRLDQKENEMVEAKWKPIMAKRKQKAEQKAEEASEERHCTERYLAERCKEHEEEAEPEGSEKFNRITVPGVDVCTNAVGVAYVEYELPGKGGKRKRIYPDRNEDCERPSKIVPQAQTLVSIKRTPEGSAETNSLHLHLIPSDPVQSSEHPASSTALTRLGPVAALAIKVALPTSTSLDQLPLSSTIHVDRGVPIPSTYSGHTDVTSLDDGEGPSPPGDGEENNLDAQFKGVMEDPRANANGKKTIMAQAFQKSLASSATPAMERNRPLKFAPKPSSRLCNRRESNYGSEDPREAGGAAGRLIQ